MKNERTEARHFLGTGELFPLYGVMMTREMEGGGKEIAYPIRYDLSEIMEFKDDGWEFDPDGIEDVRKQPRTISLN